ncbi:MAG TPA: DMT family transporter, partial [Thermoanaerobaculia bacterium]|nr:DMT family transporter [Thermoanaerobaculia bacterium]
EALYGLGCGILLNVPWGIGLLAVRHVPVTLYSVVVSSTPMWTYGLALLVGRERMSLMRVSALAVGFASSLAVILTRQGASISQIDSWLLAAMSLPLMYAFYNVYTSAAWPKGMEPLTAGIVESFASSLLAVPVVLWLDPVHSLSDFHRGYWLLAAAIAMWVLERVCFFSMIQRFGPVTTVQAVYVSTPAGVLFGLALFAEKADSWLWVSLALVMLALWLNNRAIAKAR